MSLEKFPVRKTEKKEAPQLEHKTFIDHTSQQSEIPGFNKKGEIPKQPSEADTAWEEYLRRTGNPILEIEKKRAGLDQELSRAKDSGDMKEVKKLQQEIYRLQEDEMLEDLDSVRDIDFSLGVSSRMPPLTGDIRKDAEAFFHTLGAKRAVDMLSKGGDPAQILKKYAEMADAIAERGKEDEGARKMEYSLITIRRMIERILAEAANMGQSR